LTQKYHAVETNEKQHTSCTKLHASTQYVFQLGNIICFYECFNFSSCCFIL